MREMPCWKTLTWNNKICQWKRVLPWWYPIQETAEVKESQSLNLSKCYLSLSDYGGDTIRFQGVQNLLQEKNYEILRLQVARMSCLVTMALMTDDAEVSQLINIINEMALPKKYLIIIMGTLNATLLHKRAINFNVLIQHHNVGEPFTYLVLLGYKQITLLNSQMETGSPPPYAQLWGKCMPKPIQRHVHYICKSLLGKRSIYPIIYQCPLS